MEKDVVLAIIAVLATTIGLLGWAMKYFAQTLTADLKEHTKASIELKQYLKDRNGRDAEQHKENIKAQRQVLKALKALPERLQ